MSGLLGFVFPRSRNSSGRWRYLAGSSWAMVKVGGNLYSIPIMYIPVFHTLPETLIDALTKTLTHDLYHALQQSKVDSDTLPLSLTEFRICQKPIPSIEMPKDMSVSVLMSFHTKPRFFYQNKQVKISHDRNLIFYL